MITRLQVRGEPLTIDSSDRLLCLSCPDNVALDATRFCDEFGVRVDRDTDCGHLVTAALIRWKLREFTTFSRVQNALVKTFPFVESIGFDCDEEKEQYHVLLFCKRNVIMRLHEAPRVLQEFLLVLIAALESDSFSELPILWIHPELSIYAATRALAVLRAIALSGAKVQFIIVTQSAHIIDWVNLRQNWICNMHSECISISNLATHHKVQEWSEQGISASAAIALIWDELLCLP